MSKTIGHVSTEAARMLVSIAIPLARANIELIPGPVYAGSCRPYCLEVGVAAPCELTENGAQIRQGAKPLHQAALF